MSSPIPPKNVLVIAVDRLGAGFLGPYGATWLDTPAFNRLASQSLLIEHVLADSPELAAVYASYWTGRHAAMPAAPISSLPELAADGGYRTCLMTDDWRLAEHPLALRFEEQVRVRRREGDAAAATSRGTQLAEMFTAAGEWLAEAHGPFLLWMHAEGMQGLWDAPWELRARWADEDDPSPPTFVEPPQRELTGKVDPDELLGLMHAYAGQVAVLDECLENFLADFLNSPRAADTLLVVTSPRGYPLGEHRRVGPVDNALYGELLRAPLLLRFPDGAGAAARAQALAQPPDLFATLAEWLGLPRGQDIWGRSLTPLAEGEDWPRDRALAVHGVERALRTPAWFLRRRSPTEPAEHEAPHVELYVKPDDQWEVNEVSNRLPGVVDELLAVLENLEQAIQNNEESALLPLSEILRDGVA